MRTSRNRREHENALYGPWCDFPTIRPKPHYRTPFDGLLAVLCVLEGAFDLIAPIVWDAL